MHVRFRKGEGGTDDYCCGANEVLATRTKVT